MTKIGYAIFAIAGLWMYIAEVIAFARWWDLIGILVAVFIPPVAALFPLIYWIKEGTFPVLYFVVWGVGILGIIMAAFGNEKD
ncbi:MAG: hypothetical protein Q7K55_02515 [Candidatus Levybacteria bacterium]|nr:hypothetical protein [Candidatus Levybacteria bacterium]